MVVDISSFFSLSRILKVPGLANSRLETACERIDVILLQTRKNFQGQEGYSRARKGS
jgi:hypothetical protein